MIHCCTIITLSGLTAPYIKGHRRSVQSCEEEPHCLLLKPNFYQYNTTRVYGDVSLDTVIIYVLHRKDLGHLWLG